MDQKQFLKQLGLFSLGVAVIIALLYLIPAMRPEFGFAWSCWITFILVTYIMYWLSMRSLNSPSKGLFISVSMLLNGFKIVISLILVIFYYQLFQPETKLFLIPFFITYLLYTIFEVYILSKLAKMA
ncbi:MAG: hypothetical protein AAF502_00645 [Bacteroidota bacterium]